MSVLGLKSSVLKLCLISFVVSACDRLPVNFGLRVADPETGNSIDCNDVDGAFGIVVPYYVEAESEVVLKYRGGGTASWNLQSDSGTITKEGTEVRLRFDKEGIVQGSLNAESVCLTSENHDFLLNVIPKMSAPSLKVAGDLNYTKESAVTLEHDVAGAVDMLLSTDANCSGTWEKLSAESVRKIHRENSLNTYYAKFKNQVRETACVSAKITHDSLPPNLNLVNLPLLKSNISDLNMGVESSDNLSGVQGVYCSLNSSSYEACTTSFIKKALLEGEHKLNAYALDNAGNSTNLLEYNFSIDTTAPVISWAEVPAALIIPGTYEAKAKLVVPENEIEWGCILNGDPMEKCNGEILKSLVVEGEYEFIVYAVDEVGNRSNTLSSTSIVDATGPVLQISSKPLNPSVEKSASFSLSARDELSGVAAYMCSLNGSSFSKCEKELYYPNLSNGIHSFSAYAIDQLGNAGASASYSWEIDDGIVSEQVLVGKPVKKVDIVVVVDNSSSMAKEQREMGRRFGNFVSSLSGLDWRVGIITTNADEDGPHSGGRLQNFADKNEEPIYFIDNDTVDGERLFQKTIHRKERGNDTEEAIHSLRKFLERDAVSILREESNFASIIISDEDEKSRGRNLRNVNRPDRLISSINTQFNGSKVYSNHSIVWRPGDTRCDRRGGKYEANTYAELTELTDGILGDICSDDYTSQLLSIGDRIQETAFSLALKCIPRDLDGDGEGDVQVSLDPLQNVEYRIKNNKIFFSPYPEEGTKLHLVYRCPN